MKTGEEADQLFQLAGDKFAAAVAINPVSYKAQFNWGIALRNQARAKSGSEADRLFKLASHKFAAALAIRPEDTDVLTTWSEALLWQVGQTSSEEARPLLQHALEKAAAVEAISPGKGAYNLACVRARLGDTTGCRRWLEASRAAGRLPGRDHLLSDPDLESVRGSEWFQNFLSGVN
jgi:tetratricopeptide (TPR) repeat protein